SSFLIIFENAVFTLESDFFGDPRLDFADNLGIYAVLMRYINDFSGVFFLQINFHPMAHIKHLVHFLPLCSAFFLNYFEQGRSIEKIIFHDMEIFDKMKHLGLCASAAMN